ncbi:hypothetical protein CYME_CMG083C [Cyanidioschyzon merolae strain 10D]|uniref:EF-hand domain-containing protein n=1 Tax=Cyanidioschyzon merolae (strain NIES-3377 / 10D) TaxID=280699 RepID=M1VBD3_CYAM1|nr:hypothetical protein CYME_CMG083C [Cyanidioschyzon merolae strain 10D]BAM79602.1 hypothetical protein CYME_CMG083C [Cyanidioschyzon merolae strain 10D]|eukprot:XP_005535888.1 hypothetical protein CYME_CMG083C [Cyanidioschyzon merolae strain 10D]
MSLHKSDSNQLLVSLVVEHAKRATPPPEESGILFDEKGSQISEHHAAPALEGSSATWPFVPARPREVSSGSDNACENGRALRRLHRTPSPEVTGSGSPTSHANVVGTCFVTGFVVEKDDSGTDVTGCGESRASEKTSGRPFRREVTAADSRLNLSGEHLACVSLEQLRSLPSLAALNEISLASNSLRSVDLRPLASCRSLQVLLLNDNLLERIDLTPLASCSQLERLWLHRNKLKHIDLSPLAISGSALRSLYLSRNELQEISLAPLEKCSKLRALQLEGNPNLKEIDVTPLFACRELSSFEAPPQARLIVRELAALEVQRRSYQQDCNSLANVESSESARTAAIMPSKLVLPKVFRRRGIVLHWIREALPDANLRDLTGQRSLKENSVNAELQDAERGEGIQTNASMNIIAPASEEALSSVAELQTGPTASRNLESVQEDKTPLCALIVGMTTHRRISTCRLLEQSGTLRVLQSPSAAAALDAYISAPDGIDLILMEPAEYEVFSEQAQAASIEISVPVVAVGPPEFERSGVFRRCIAIGARGFISFPLDNRDAQALTEVARSFRASRQTSASQVLKESSVSELLLPTQEVRADSTSVSRDLSPMSMTNGSDASKYGAGIEPDSKWVPSWWQNSDSIRKEGNSSPAAVSDRMDTFLSKSEGVEDIAEESSTYRFIQRAGIGHLRSGSPICRSGSESSQFACERAEWARVEAIFAHRDKRPSREPCFQLQFMQHCSNPATLLIPTDGYHSAGLERFADIAAVCRLPKTSATVLFLRVLSHQDKLANSGTSSISNALTRSASESVSSNCWLRNIHVDAFYHFYRCKLAPIRSPLERFYNVIASSWPGSDIHDSSSSLYAEGKIRRLKESRARYVSRYTITLLIQELVYRKLCVGRNASGVAVPYHAAKANQGQMRSARYSYQGKSFLSSSINQSGSASAMESAHFSSKNGEAARNAFLAFRDEVCEVLLTASVASACVWFHLGGGNRNYVPLSILRKVRFAEAIFAAERGIIVDSLMEMLTGNGIALVAQKELETVWNYNARTGTATSEQLASRDAPSFECSIPSVSGLSSSFPEQQSDGAVTQAPSGATESREQIAGAIRSSFLPDTFEFSKWCRKFCISREAAVSYFLDRGSLVPKAVEQVLNRFRGLSLVQKPASSEHSAATPQLQDEKTVPEDQNLAPFSKLGNASVGDSLSPSAFVHLFLALCDPGNEKALHIFFDIMDLDMDGFISAADVAYFYREKCEIAFREGLVLASANNLWAQLVDMCRTSANDPKLESKGITLKMLRDIGERRRSSFIRNVLFKDDGMALVDIQQTLRLENSLALLSQP